MATLHKETDLLERILTECEEDYVGLWSIYRRVRDAGWSSDPRSSTLALLQFLLISGIVEAGAPDASGCFHPWQLGPDDAVRRIELEWTQLGREPDIGDIVWFTSREVEPA